MLLTKRGFTLIELLVVISIIGLLSTLILTAVSGQKNRAKDVSFQSTAKSVQAAAGICCSSNIGLLKDVLGGNICEPSSQSIYPESSNLGSVEIIRNCGAVEGFSIKLMPGTSNKSAVIDYALCDQNGCEYINH